MTHKIICCMFNLFCMFAIFLSYILTTELNTIKKTKYSEEKHSLFFNFKKSNNQFELSKEDLKNMENTIDYLYFFNKAILADLNMFSNTLKSESEVKSFFMYLEEAINLIQNHQDVWYYYNKIFHSYLDLSESIFRAVFLLIQFESQHLIHFVEFCDSILKDFFYEIDTYCEKLRIALQSEIAKYKKNSKCKLDNTQHYALLARYTNFMLMLKGFEEVTFDQQNLNFIDLIAFWTIFINELLNENKSFAISDIPDSKQISLQIPELLSFYLNSKAQIAMIVCNAKYTFNQKLYSILLMIQKE